MVELQKGHTVRASAPGKLVLCGEYAVLDGAPAICMAIDRRARVAIATSEADHHTVSAPGFSEVPGYFEDKDGEIVWLAGCPEFRLVGDVWHTANARTNTSLAIVLDSSEFVDAGDGSKIGVGSSAALTVALSAVLSELAETDADASSIAFAAHRRFQDGLGSGTDVACSISGGLIEYTMGARQPQKLRWPEGLAYAVLWSGVAASTARKLAHLDRQAVRSSHATLVAAARALAKAWASASVATILSEYRDYTEALREFSLDHELGVFDAGHEELVRLANTAGLVYKPCGAGGGDIGILLADNEAAIRSFIGNELPASFKKMNMQIDIQGVRVNREPS